MNEYRLPWPPGTYDRSRQRAATSVTEILRAHVLPSRQRLLLDNFDAILASDSSTGNGTSNTSSTSSHTSSSGIYDVGIADLPAQRKPKGWERSIHWHVYDFPTLSELLRCLGFRIDFRELVEPYHMIIMAQKLA